MRQDIQVGNMQNITPADIKKLHLGLREFLLNVLAKERLETVGPNCVYTSWYRVSL